MQATEPKRDALTEQKSRAQGTPEEVWLYMQTELYSMKKLWVVRRRAESTVGTRPSGTPNTAKLELLTTLFVVLEI